MDEDGMVAKAFLRELISAILQRSYASRFEIEIWEIISRTMLSCGVTVQRNETVGLVKGLSRTDHHLR